MEDPSSSHMVWIDTELTGLELDTCHILEVACVITDQNLKIVSDELDIIIHQPDDILTSMNEWCTEYHEKTGLTKASRESKISLAEAEQTLLEFLKKYIPPGTCPLAGNTVYMDRMFLRKYMPQLNEYMHYRIVDVSTIKELTRRWNPRVFANVPPKLRIHRALEDIKESIQELQYYRNNVLKCEEN